jgi:hypothetical protein
MRRSRDYQDAYRRHRENPKAEMDMPERLRKFEWWQSFGLFCSEPPDPNLTFEELMDDERYRLLDDPLFRLGVISRNDRTESAVSFFTYREESVDFQKFDRLRLDVDLPRVRDIRTLTRMITRIVEDHWQHYERRHRRRKAHPDEHDYDLLLKIGDMKDGQGMNYRQIAEQIFPQDSHPKSARRRAAKYYRIYRKLIGGGYKQLALP